MVQNTEARARAGAEEARWKEKGMTVEDVRQPPMAIGPVHMHRHVLYLHAESWTLCMIKRLRSFQSEGGMFLRIQNFFLVASRLNFLLY